MGASMRWNCASAIALSSASFRASTRVNARALAAGVRAAAGTAATGGTAPAGASTAAGAAVAAGAVAAGAVAAWAAKGPGGGAAAPLPPAPAQALQPPQPPKAPSREVATAPPRGGGVLDRPRPLLLGGVLLTRPR